jgi:hypothetical protein
MSTFVVAQMLGTDLRGFCNWVASPVGDGGSFEGTVRSRPGGIFFDISGDPASAGGGHTRFVYQPSMKPGWVFSTTVYDGLHPLLGVFISGDLGLVLLVASDSFFTGDAMVVGHLARPARSTTSQHVGLFGMLLLVPLQNSEATSSGGWSASRCFLRPLVTKMTESFLQGHGCNFLFFQGCSCKMIDVNCQNI